MREILEENEERKIIISDLLKERRRLHDKITQLGQSNKKMLGALRRCGALIRHLKSGDSNHPQDGEVILSFIETLIKESEFIN